MRGEHRTVMRSMYSVVGSSPHARGAREHAPAVIAGRGIIPACAGSTSVTNAYGRCKRDHPRMRGEHFMASLFTALSQGSSPHARGALAADAFDSRHVGIIPACAGSTLSRGCMRLSARDHPRMRGEHAPVPRTSPGMAGSSPHARGALLPDEVGLRAPGIIPACAGSTRGRPRTRSPPTDHPRMRGEHLSKSRWKRR